MCDGCHGRAAFPGNLVFGSELPVSQVSAATAFGEWWIEQLLARYNAEGTEALGDLRRRNGASATIMKPELLAELHGRLCKLPPDGGLGDLAVEGIPIMANRAVETSPTRPRARFATYEGG